VTPETSTNKDLVHGRDLYSKRAWADAYAQLANADRTGPLADEDLARLATTAFLTGKDVESAEAWTRAHEDALRRGDAAAAARYAFHVGFQSFGIGELAQGMGWLARAGRVLDDAALDCVERGWLLIPQAIRVTGEGDFGGAHALFTQAGETATRFGDRELINMARYGRGETLIRSGRVADGLALVDETMIAISAGEIYPSIVGTLYCSAIEMFKGIFDLRRAQEWTAALSRWCEAQPDLVPFRGPCLLFRAELMQLHGAWSDAMEESVRAGEWLARRPGDPVAGEVFYRQAEIHRLRGDLAKADELYREASRRGKTPLPGLALLRLAQGQVDAALASLRRAIEETHDRAARGALLAAYVETLLSARDVRAARAAAVELSELGAGPPARLLDAIAAQAMGSVQLAEGDARGAIPKLRSSWSAWRDLDAPYEAARLRVLVGLAYRAVHDEDGAEMELDAARGVFQELGAAVDLARIDSLSRAPSGAAAGGLTAREIEVLRLVATGRTNHAIAVELVISEKTVARHVSNIFDKLGVSSRSAATAYAYEHKLV
jgi:DNA-binding CsgD family transcriptional regulator/tetratricopeptide (TPR) repeat protein